MSLSFHSKQDNRWKKCADFIVDNKHVYKVVVERGIDQSLLVVKCNLTNVKTDVLRVSFIF